MATTNLVIVVASVCWLQCHCAVSCNTPVARAPSLTLLCLSLDSLLLLRLRLRLWLWLLLSPRLSSVSLVVLIVMIAVLADIVACNATVFVRVVKDVCFVC